MGSMSAVSMGWEGGRGGGGRCTHIQGCTLNDHYCVVFVLFFSSLERVLFAIAVVVDIPFSLEYLYVDSSNSHPIASSELWQIKLCLHQTCFLYPQTYLKHFFF